MLVTYAHTPRRFYDLHRFFNDAKLKWSTQKNIRTDSHDALILLTVDFIAVAIATFSLG